MADEKQVLVNVSGKSGELVTSGKAVLMAVLLYEVESDQLHFLFPDNRDKDESWAIINRLLKVPDYKVSDGGLS